MQRFWLQGNKMANSNTPESKRLRGIEANNRKKRIVAQGGKNLSIVLWPDANDALTEILSIKQENNTSLMNRLIIEERDRLKNN